MEVACLGCLIKGIITSSDIAPAYDERKGLWWFNCGTVDLPWYMPMPTMGLSSETLLSKHQRSLACIHN